MESLDSVSYGLADVSERNTTVCHNCQKPFKEEYIIILNPSEENEPALQLKMKSRRLANKSDIKALKRKAGEAKNGKRKEAKKRTNQRLV